MSLIKGWDYFFFDSFSQVGLSVTNILILVVLRTHEQR